MGFLRVAVVLVVFSGVVYVSEQAGVPDKLPGAALGWNLLFHLERAAAVLGACGVVLLVGWRAMHGEFPIRFGAAGAAAEATAAQERRLRVIEVLNGIRDPADI
jgi:hypothetical protein